MQPQNFKILVLIRRYLSTFEWQKYYLLYSLNETITKKTKKTLSVSFRTLRIEFNSRLCLYTTLIFFFYAKTVVGNGIISNCT